MKWYFIVLIVLVAILILTIITAYMCNRIAFYNKNVQLFTDKEDVILPDEKIFGEYKEEIIADIKYARSLKYQEISIKSFDGLTLKGKYYEYQKGAPIEIMFHGYKGNGERDLSTGIKRVFACKRNALIVNQRASGDSEGHIITFGVKESKDCLVWINKVIELFGEETKIILTGVSMGAATVVNASGYDLPKNVIGVLADCGYDSTKEIIKKYIKDMKLSPTFFYPFVKLGAKLFGHFNLEEITPIKAIKNTKVPVIFFHGDNDTFVPYTMSENLYNNFDGIKKIVIFPNAAHGVCYLVDKDKYINELNSFFK